MDKNVEFYLFATQGCNYTRNFERLAGLNREKLGTFKPGQYQPSTEDFKPGFKEKMRFFLKKKARVIVWSFDYQQQIYCLHEFSFHFLLNRWTNVFSGVNWQNR